MATAAVIHFIHKVAWRDQHGVRNATRQSKNEPELPATNVSTFYVDTFVSASVSLPFRLLVSTWSELSHSKQGSPETVQRDRGRGSKNMFAFLGSLMREGFNLARSLQEVG